MVTQVVVFFFSFVLGSERDPVSAKRYKSKTLCQTRGHMSVSTYVYAFQYATPRHPLPGPPTHTRQVRVGRGFVQQRGGGEPAVRAAVAALPRLSLGLEDVEQGGGGGARERSALGKSERLSSITAVQ